MPGCMGSLRTATLLVVLLWFGEPAHAVNNRMHRSLLQYEDHAPAASTGASCESQGDAAAFIASEIACHQLRILCSTGKDVFESDHNAGKDASPYTNLEPQCRRAAINACRTSARSYITEVQQSECSRLLLHGPEIPVSRCWNLQEAVDEFNWTIKAVCEEEPSLMTEEQANYVVGG